MDNSVIPAWQAAAACTTLIGAIGVLWVWGLGLSNGFAVKIEELTKAGQAREDERDARCEQRCASAVAAVELRASHDLALARTLAERQDKMIESLREAHDRYRGEVEALERTRVVELRDALRASTEALEEAVHALEKKGA